MPNESRSPLSRRRVTDLPLAAPSRGGAHVDADLVPHSMAQTAETADPPAWPALNHIPRYLFVPELDCEGQRGPVPVVGAHRFQKAPTPVMGAAMSLLGFSAVTTACQPYRSVTRSYQCTRLVPARRTGRVPKV